MYAAEAFKVGHNTIDGTGAERIASNEQRMEREDHA